MRRKILVLVSASVLVSLASLGVLGYLYVRSSVNHSFEDHAELSSTIASEIDYNLEENIWRLLEVYLTGDADLMGGDLAEERENLKVLYKYSIFSGGVFIVDRHGDIRMTYPYLPEDMANILSVPAIDRALFSGMEVVSDVYTDARTGRKYIYVIVPVKSHSGGILGAVGGMIDPTKYAFSQVIRSAPYTDKHIIELVDSRGAVIASNRLDRVLTLSDHNRFMEGLIASGKPATVRCHRCHATGQEVTEKPERSDILVFAPLAMASWGVVIRMPEEVVFQPTRGLVKATLAVGAVLVATALFLAAGLSRSIADPVYRLTRATRRIAGGELERPVEISGEDEIGELAESLEGMRRKLFFLVSESTEYSNMLENEVGERTRELLLKKRQLASLLQEMIATQEDERRRIAQELHDDTAQSIAALGMAIDMAVKALEDKNLTPDMLMELRVRVSTLLDDIGRIIKNLRPSVLDDLGLESALEWMLDRNLKPRGISYFLDADGIGKGTLSKQAELSVFRMMQEALNNVVKHSEATHVSMGIKKMGQEVRIEVLDDGVGYDIEEVSSLRPHEDLIGFGMLGMRERVEQLGGEMEVVSSPGEGTAIYMTVPAMEVEQEIHNGKD
jgi:signal transduction histidine kinase